MRFKIILVLAVVFACGVAGLVAHCAGKDAPAAAIYDPRGSFPADGSVTDPEPPMFAYKTIGDIVDICQSELRAQGLLEDEVGFGPVLRNAQPKTPIFVKSLDKDYPDYYLVNFTRENKVVAVVIMGVKDGKAELKECHRFDPQPCFPPVTAEVAKSNAKSAKMKSGPGQARLVFKFSAQCPGAALPAWDLGNNVHVAQNGQAFSDFAPEIKTAQPW